MSTEQFYALLGMICLAPHMPRGTAAVLGLFYIGLSVLLTVWK